MEQLLRLRLEIHITRHWDSHLLFVSLFDHFLVTIQQGQLSFFTILGLMLAYPNSPKPLRGGKE
jgi:hypothetical protein